MKAKEFTDKLRYRKEAFHCQSGFWIHENKLPEILEEYKEKSAKNILLAFERFLHDEYGESIISGAIDDFVWVNNKSK